MLPSFSIILHPYRRGKNSKNSKKNLGTKNKNCDYKECQQYQVNYFLFTIFLNLLRNIGIFLFLRGIFV